MIFKDKIENNQNNSHKLGLKLWSINTDNYLYEAIRLFENGFFDYIELYIVPDNIDKLKNWQIAKKNHNIPFTLHAPHFMHGINLADKEKETFNMKIFEQVKAFSDELDANYVVIHGGIEGKVEETIRQLKMINLSNMLIENKPYIAPIGERFCRGAFIEEIKHIITEVGCGFCLDVGHAICSANSFKKEPYSYLEEFNNLKPVCYHLSDGFIDSEIDKHLNFGGGNFDFNRIFDIIDRDKNIAIETKKNSKENLDDFVKDVRFLKGLY